jgi:hypothetical protein
MDYSIRTLQTRGSNHDLHCEDDFMTHETEKYLICACFDGCSSGINSHIASYNHKKLLKEAIDDYCFFRTREIFLDWDQNISKCILDSLYDSIYEMNFEMGKEMLSTVLLLVVNKETEEYEITFCGDGVCCVDGEYTDIHDPNGDTVWYLSTVYTPQPIDTPCNKTKTFRQFFEEYYNLCPKKSGKGFNSISISTDGIDTFKNQFGQKTEAREYFCNNDKFSNLENQLKRLYNIFTKGLNTEEKIPCVNQDDFTLISLKKIN